MFKFAILKILTTKDGREQGEIAVEFDQDEVLKRLSMRLSETLPKKAPTRYGFPAKEIPTGWFWNEVQDALTAAFKGVVSELKDTSIRLR